MAKDEEQTEEIVTENQDDLDKRIDYVNRDFFIFEEISQESIKHIIKGIGRINNFDDAAHKLFPKSKRTPIKIYLNSEGGEMYMMFGLVDVIRNSKTPVYTYATGLVASAALGIFLVGHKRFMDKYGTILYHNIKIMGVTDNTYKQLSNESIETKRLQKMYDEIITSNSTLTQKQLDDWKRENIDIYIDYKRARRFKMLGD